LQFKQFSQVECGLKSHQKSLILKEFGNHWHSGQREEATVSALKLVGTGKKIIYRQTDLKGRD
jgi:hypothetical protein